MSNYKKWGLALTALIISVIAYAHTNTTLTSRLKIPYPDLGFEGGAALHANQSAMTKKIGDSINSRYEEFTAIADSTLVTHDHNFGVVFDELTVLIYTGTGTNLIRVQDPIGDGWLIAANGATPKLKVDVTTPPSGGPHTFTVVVIHGSGVESIDDLDDVDITTSTPEDGQALVWDGSNFVPGASGDSSFKFQGITGTDLTIKAGYLILSDGREIRLAADLTYDLSGIVSDGDYYFYIDLAGMPAAAVVGGRLVHSISATDIDTSISTPDVIAKEYFYPLGLAQRSGGTWSNPQTLAVRTHNNDRSITDWQATRDYYTNQLVVSDNNLWKSKADFTSGGSFVESNWELLSNNFGVPTRISISAPATPSIATLVNGKHYIVDMTNATQDVLVGLQEGAAKTTIRVTLYNNPSSYNLNIDGFGAEKILYGETQYDDVDMGNILSWAQFVWDNTNSYWLVDDPSVFFAGTFNGDLNVTGALTVDTDTLVVDKVNKFVGVGTATPGYNVEVQASSASIVVDNTNSASGANILFQSEGTNIGGLIGYGTTHGTDANDVVIKNYTATGDIDFFTNTLTRMTIDSTGNVGIATTVGATTRTAIKGFGTGTNNILSLVNGNSQTALNVKDDFTIQMPNLTTTGTGNPLHITSAGVLWENTSSIRFKENVRDSDKYLSKLLELRPVIFDRKDTDITNRLGLIAEEVVLVIENVVNYDEDKTTPRGIDYGLLTVPIIKAIQEQQQIIEDQKEQVLFMKAWICEQDNAPESLCLAM